MSLTINRAPELRYTFGLQATPVKPKTLDAWDHRIVICGYGRLTEKVGDKPALTYLADNGVKNIILWSSWTDVFGYPAPVGHEEEFRRMIRECHRLGMKLIVYLGSYLSDGCDHERADSHP